MRTRRFSFIGLREAVLCAIGLICAAFCSEGAEPPGCSGCLLTAGATTPLHIASSGCSVPFRVRVGNGDGTACNQTNLTVILVCPGSTPNSYGVTNVLRTGLNIGAGVTPFTVTDTFGEPITIPCWIASPPGVTSVRALAYATNNPGGCQFGPDDFSTAGGTISLTVTHPALQVTTQCLSATNGVGNSVVITYSGTVTNSGDTPLFDLTVQNDQDTPNSTVLQIPFLLIGGATNFIRSYTNTGRICGPFTHMLTVTGTDAQNQSAECASASATNNSSPATIQLPCLGVRRSPDRNYELSCATEPGRNYTVQFTDSLSAPAWNDLTNFMAMGSIFIVRDDQGPPQRFYRLLPH